jgi:glycine/D-amino acid oxidase-like deaminating enzyme
VPASDIIDEEPRRTPVVQTCDVCVLGGRCTGVFAAVRAAQCGAKVALVEKQNAFGAIRVMVNLNQVGEAAGVTASLAASGETAVCKVDAAFVRDELSKLGAVII